MTSYDKSSTNGKWPRIWLDHYMAMIKIRPMKFIISTLVISDHLTIVDRRLFNYRYFAIALDSILTEVVCAVNALYNGAESSSVPRMIYRVCWNWTGVYAHTQAQAFCFITGIPYAIIKMSFAGFKKQLNKANQVNCWCVHFVIVILTCLSDSVSLRLCIHCVSASGSRQNLQQYASLHPPFAGPVPPRGRWARARTRGRGSDVYVEVFFK